MKKNFKSTEKNEEIISLNTDLYDGFFIQELEYRLETDPLMLVGLMDLFSSEGECMVCNGYTSCDTQCYEYGDCPNHCLGYFSCNAY
jgi:hypothetical protein